MTELDRPSAGTLIDECVRAFEEAWAAGEDPSLGDYLPPTDHPSYARAARELARVDLELAWACGRPRTAEDYRREHPAAFRDSDALHDLAFEEYRQRRAHGEDPDPADFAARFGVRTDHWPGKRPAPARSHSVGEDDRLSDTMRTAVAPDLAAASLAYPRFRDAAPPTSDYLPSGPSGAGGDAAELFRAVHRSDPEAAHRLAEAVLQMPEVGSDFLGFRLAGELGRGAFGQVFLAYQGELADRPVALKVSADLQGESQTLARLQHTNIVPIYSVHRAGPFQAVCMPYLGAATLADVVGGLKDGSVPASGQHFVSTVNDCRSRVRAAAETVRSAGPAGAGLPAPLAPVLGEVPRPAAAEPALQRLAGASYVEAVLWLTARLADGLAHAHERGVVHRDLKPANVLLTDDGQPMLLDFNLSENAAVRGTASGAKMGGTLPYMSPEQLAAFRGERRPVDARSDLYSLGLIIYQLLAGHHPFPMVKGVVLDKAIRAAEAARGQGPPPLRPHNPAVTPAVESIVRKCLAPDPADRYPSARALAEDLERHLADRPLKYAPEPSFRERAGKWARRHPRLSSSTTVAAVAAALFATAAAAGYAGWNHHLAGLEAERREQSRLAAAAGAGRLRQAKLTQAALLGAPDRAAADRLAAAAEQALAEYQILDDPDWHERPRVADLPDVDRAAVRRDVGDMLLTWADAEQARAAAESDPARRAAAFAKALRLNERAEAVLGPGGGGKTLRLQRARLAQALDRPDAAALARAADRTPPATAADCFHQARELVKRNEFKKAIPLLLRATREDPAHFWAWHYLGNCYYELLQYQEAIACYSACLGLTPDPAVAYFPHYHRALVHAAQGLYADAEADLTRAVECLPALPPELAARERSKPRLLRARVHAEQRELAAAEADLTAALESGPNLEVLIERAKVRGARGDAAGAEADRAAALALEPADEVAWNARGLARLPGDPRGALADFEAALKINPDFHQALQNKAHVLAEHLDRPAEALAVVNRLIAQYPGYVRARVGRGVLLARQGKRDAALADARESLARDRSPLTLYQVANIYALTSRQAPADRDKVLPLLGAALWGGFGLDVVDSDPDLEPVRDQAGFRGLVGVVRELEAELRKKEW